jgi:hypothetical protein
MGVLGGTINFKDAHNAWMTNDEANHRFAFLSVPGLEDDPDKVKYNAMHHSAFEYESFSDLMSSYARMRDEGIVPAFSLDHGITMSLYYKDRTGTSSSCRAIISAIGSDRPSGCEHLPISDQSHRDVFQSREGVSSVRERPVVRGATARHPRWEILTGLDPQHRLADFRQHGALSSPTSSRLTAWPLIALKNPVHPDPNGSAY